MCLHSKSLNVIGKQFVSGFSRFSYENYAFLLVCYFIFPSNVSDNFLTADQIKLLSVTMPTAGTWKVPFRGKFGAYDANLRVVPPFSVQSLQKATVVQPPPRCHSAGGRLSKSKTTFKRYS